MTTSVIGSLFFPTMEDLQAASPSETQETQLTEEVRNVVVHELFQAEFLVHVAVGGTWTRVRVTGLA